MKHTFRISFLSALVVALVAPAALEQDAVTEAAPDPAAQAAPAESAATQKTSWNDVDVDQDGKLSQSEAAVVPALVAVFAEADADADGALTPDEYQAYVARVQGGAAAGADTGSGG